MSVDRLSISAIPGKLNDLGRLDWFLTATLRAVTQFNADAACVRYRG